MPERQPGFVTQQTSVSSVLACRHRGPAPKPAIRPRRRRRRFPSNLNSDHLHLHLVDIIALSHTLTPRHVPAGSQNPISCPATVLYTRSHGPNPGSMRPCPQHARRSTFSSLRTAATSPLQPTVLCLLGRANIVSASRTIDNNAKVDIPSKES
jgi:hypothetical protein